MIYGSPPTVRPATSRRATLDANFFPHIMDTIIQYASYPLLIAFRGTCKGYRDFVDERLARHLVLSMSVPPTCAAGLHPAFSSFPSPHTSSCTVCKTSKRLFPYTHILDVHRGDPFGYDHDKDSFPSLVNVQVLRVHFSGPLDSLRENIKPGLIVFTTAAMMSINYGRHLSLVSDSRDLPSSPAKIVVNVPWSSCPNDGEVTYYFDGGLFETTTDFVFIFVDETEQDDSPMLKPDVVRPLLRAFATHLHVTKQRGLAVGLPAPAPIKNLTLVDLPSIDFLYDGPPRPESDESDGETPLDDTDDSASLEPVDPHTRAAHAVAYLENKLVTYENKPAPFSDDEITSIIRNVTFLSREEYKASIPYKQYLLETCVDPSDCF